jgi:hypothetical protein
MHLSGFDIMMLAAVPLAMFATGAIAWWAGLARYRGALAGERRIPAHAAEARRPAPMPVTARAARESAQPAPAPLAAGGSSESAVLLTP